MNNPENMTPPKKHNNSPARFPWEKNYKMPVMEFKIMILSSVMYNRTQIHERKKSGK